MERMAILCDGKEIAPSDLPEKIWRDAGRERPAAAPVQIVEAGFVWPTLDHLKDQGLGLKEFLDSVEERLLLEALELASGVKNSYNFV